MIKLWNKTVRFFHRKRIAEIADIEEMYGTAEGLENRLEQLYDRYAHLNDEMPGESLFKPGDVRPSIFETITEWDQRAETRLVYEKSEGITPVKNRVAELLKEKPTRRWDDL